MIIKNTNYNQIINLGISGRIWLIKISLDGANYYVSMTSSMQEIDNGNYTLHLSATDMNADVIVVLIEEINNPLLNLEPILFEVTINTDIITLETATYLNTLQSEIDELKHQVYPGDGTVMWTYAVYTDETYNVPLEGCLVKMSSDEHGELMKGGQLTDSLGETKWFVNPGGVYYMWRQKTSWRFTNPDVETVNLIAPFVSYSQALPNDAIKIKEDLIDWTYAVYEDKEMTKPLGGCQVEITTNANGSGFVGRKITDKNGITYWKIKPGMYYVWKTKSGYDFENPDIQNPPETTVPLSSLSIEEIDWKYTVYVDNIPLPGCEVIITKNIDKTGFIGKKITNKDGETYWKLKPGKYHIWREKNNYYFDNPDIQNPPETDIPVVKEIDWKYSVFADAQLLEPLAGCHILIAKNSNKTGFVGEKTTDNQGNTYWKIPPGEYYIWKTKKGFSFVNPTYEIVEEITQ